MAEQERGHIVVGVDGSESSQQALGWAVRQAFVTGAVVDAVTAWQYPVSYGWGPTDLDGRIAVLARDTLEKAIAGARQQAPADQAAVEIRPHVVESNPAQALLDASDGASLLVVGSRGHGGVVGTLLGSVSLHCVHHASCPVVVVRGQDATGGGTRS